jgi:hypothetical protein
MKILVIGRKRPANKYTFASVYRRRRRRRRKRKKE